MRLADVVVPDTTSAALALEVVTAYSVPALVNHFQRSYRLAASLAVIEGFAVDHEVLWVAAMVHDLGLEDPFDSHRLPFEQAGLPPGSTSVAGRRRPGRSRCSSNWSGHSRASTSSPASGRA